MSVINQMLKDLEGRSAEQQNASGTRYIPSQEKSSLNLVVISILALVILLLVSFLFWQLNQENTLLKQQSASSPEIAEQLPVLNTQKNNSISSDSEALSIKNVIENNDLSLINKAPVTKSEQDKSVVNSVPKTEKTPLTIEKVDALAEQKTLHPEQHLHPHPHTNNSHVGHSNTEHSHTAQLQHSSSINTEKKAPIAPVKETQQKQHELTPEKSSLSISRKQLSPKELAAQKMNKAERALAENKIEEAEKLFEDIILIMPTNQVARKQLAALWYGRQSYQPALNLLQQGIVIDSGDQELRIMKARIYLTMGQVEKAYDVLSVLKDNTDIEYQSLLANAAQQIGNHTAAANAYLTLVQLVPQNGRFWLGLAVAYDSNSQFSEAVTAYNSAIVQGGLSNSALKFAKHRMEELGE